MDVVFHDPDEAEISTWFQDFEERDEVKKARQAEYLEEVARIASKFPANDKCGVGWKPSAEAEPTTAAQGALAKRLRKAERAALEDEPADDSNKPNAESASSEFRGGQTRGWIDPLAAYANAPKKRRR